VVVLQKLLASLVPILGKAIFDYAVEWLKDPANRDDIEAAATFVATHATAATPWKWDDHLVKAIAYQVGNKLPDLGALTTVVAQLQQFVGRLPNLGGLFGGGR
jgi:hypothetical protein